MKEIMIQRMSWTDFRDAMKETDTVIVPLGVTEEHGPHIPLSTDTMIADHCAKLIGEKTGTPVAPTMPYGYAANVRKFPGSTSLDPQTYRALMTAYLESYIRHGAKRFLLVNGHGGNIPVLDTVVADLYDKHGVVCFHNDWWSVLPQIDPELNCHDHGGYYETSMLMAARPDVPNMDLAVDVGQSCISAGITKQYTWSFQGAPVGIQCDVTKFNRVGNVGNSPIGANKELGDKMTQMYVDFNVDLLKAIQEIKLEDFT